jgi:hypothetical protein
VLLEVDHAVITLASADMVDLLHFTFRMHGHAVETKHLSREFDRFEFTFLEVEQNKPG